MKALVLDGGAQGDELTAAAVDAVRAALERDGYEVEPVTVRERRIAACRGCFGCWTRTPGECVIDDDGRKLVEDFVASDVCAYVTPVTFGGYSSILKTALDRMIPVLDPRFTKVAGEVHHRLRYERHPKRLVLGTLPEPDRESEDVFRELVRRNGLNWHAEGLAEVASGTEGVEAAVARLMSRSEVAA